MNEELRLKSGKSDMEFGKVLDSVLPKLPNFDGLVYRRVNLTKGEFKQYENAFETKEIVTEHTFISTSKSRLIAMEFGGNTLFRIYSRTGKEIEKIAKFGIHSPPNEQEVLFSPNRQFRVLEVRNEGTYTLISMEEI